MPDSPSKPADALDATARRNPYDRAIDAIMGLRAAATPRPIATVDRNSGVLSRTARFAARLDAHLLTLPDDAARRSFLDRERNKWTDRYETFQADMLAGRYSGNATAWDYAISIADIESRRACFAPVKPRLVR